MHLFKNDYTSQVGLHGHVRKLDFAPPAGVLFVLRSLERAGFETMFVDGCVRDALRGVVPDDFDLASQATPAEVRDVLEPLGYHVFPTGLKHGTVMTPVDGEKVEVTTYRIDGEYFDQRHCEAEFTRSVAEDLARRDLTFNALALVPSEDGLCLVVDIFGGEEVMALGVPQGPGVGPRARFAA